jgi:hypothetical protein
MKSSSSTVLHSLISLQINVYTIQVTRLSMREGVHNSVLHRCCISRLSLKTLSNKEDSECGNPR